MNPVAVIRTQTTDSADLGDVVLLWCPGCKSLHAPCIRRGTTDRPVWTFNGNLERPTFEPSILVTWAGLEHRCHSFLRDGRWQFLDDSTHELAGQTVDVVPLPDWVVKDV